MRRVLKERKIYITCVSFPLLQVRLLIEQFHYLFLIIPHSFPELLSTILFSR